MTQEILLMVLLAACILQVLELGAVLFLLSGIRRQKAEPVRKTEIHYESKPADSRISRREGRVICRSCYAAISTQSRVCPMCNGKAGER